MAEDTIYWYFGNGLAGAFALAREVVGALNEKRRLAKEGRVGYRRDTDLALVKRADISVNRRRIIRTMFFTGVRPGEFHALRVNDFCREHDVRYLHVREQLTFPLKGYPSRIAPLKTVWCKRKIPVHPSLEGPLSDWIKTGWAAFVGRAPKGDDFLFPDEDGKGYREQRSRQFLDDLSTAGCDTVHKEHTLDMYTLRHSFATIARRAHVLNDVRDRLLGHRPKDTKSTHYEDEDALLALLAEEVAKIPALLDPPEVVELSQRRGNAA